MLKDAQPLQTTNLSDQIAVELRRRILAGEFRPGDKLSEGAIAKAFGVSRAPVREALRVLVSEGLADQEVRKGVRVPSFDMDHFRELSELREALETMAARLAALNADGAALARLNDLLAQTSQVISESPDHMYPGDLDLHECIADASANAVIAVELKATNTRLQLVRLLSGMSQERASQAYEEHAEIVRSIASGDPDRAEAAMRTHLHRAFAHASAVLIEADAQ
jgi:DNA-binding GntR family transcriptional regulator